MGQKVTGVYRGTFAAADLIDSASVTPTTTTWTELGRYTVTAGQGIMLGYGNRSGQDDAEGRAFTKLQSSVPAVLNGYVRFDIHDPSDRPRATLWEGRTEVLNTSATDRRQQVPFPVRNPALPENWAVVLKFKGDAATAVSKADSTVTVDYTNMTVSQV